MKIVDTNIDKSIRQSHLDLYESCIERGGNSTVHKGVLAEFLNTNIPSGRILLCHACHNGNCSNPKHLYWGTDKENKADALSNGFQNIWQNTVKKYGYELACQMNRRPVDVLSKEGKIGGSRKKSDAHKSNISKSLRGKKNALKKNAPIPQLAEGNDLKS
jgi:hypothetical protein